MSRPQAIEGLPFREEVLSMRHSVGPLMKWECDGSRPMHARRSQVLASPRIHMTEYDLLCNDKFISALAFLPTHYSPRISNLYK